MGRGPSVGCSGAFSSVGFGYPSGRRGDQGGSEEGEVERHTPEDVGNELGQTTPHRAVRTFALLRKSLDQESLASLRLRSWLACSLNP